GDVNEDESPPALPGPRHSLADRGHHGVAIQEHGVNSERLREALRQVDVGEAVYVRGVVDDPGEVVERTGSRARRAGELARGRPHRGERGPRALRDRGDDVLRAGPRGRPLVTSDDARDRLLVAGDNTPEVRGT